MTNLRRLASTCESVWPVLYILSYRRLAPLFIKKLQCIRWRERIVLFPVLLFSVSTCLVVVVVVVVVVFFFFQVSAEFENKYIGPTIKQETIVKAPGLYFERTSLRIAL